MVASPPVAVAANGAATVEEMDVSDPKDSEYFPSDDEADAGSSSLTFDTTMFGRVAVDFVTSVFSTEVDILRQSVHLTSLKHVL